MEGVDKIFVFSVEDETLMGRYKAITMKNYLEKELFIVGYTNNILDLMRKWYFYKTLFLMHTQTGQL